MSTPDELRSQVDRLLDQLSRIDEPDEPGVRQLLVNQTRKRIRNIEDDANSDGSLRLRFIDSDEPDRHTMRTNFLGTTLRDMQSSFNYMVWSTEAGPSVHGDVPAPVARRASTEVLAFDPGSFVVVLRKLDLDMFDPFGQSVETMLDLMDAAEDSTFGEEVANIVSILGTQASVRLQRVFQRLGREGVSLDIDWRGSRSRRSFLSAGQATALANWMSEAESTEG